MQAEAEAQLDRLSQLDAARAELLAVVTHELRTPLAVVRAYVDLLADAAAANAAGPSVDVVENWRAGATDQVTRLDRLVDSILASVRGEGLTGLRREPFDVVSAIDRTVGTLALLLRTRAVRWNPPGYALVARGDETRFRQVLEHLLDNEAKYAPPEQAVSLGVWRTAEEIQVYITDDGPGVPFDDWEAVFQPYVRVDRVRSRGLGDRAVRGPPADGGDGRPGLDREERVRRVAVHGGVADRLRPWTGAPGLGAARGPCASRLVVRRVSRDRGPASGSRRVVAARFGMPDPHPGSRRPPGGPSDDPDP